MVVITDLLIRISDLTIFYTDEGALPRNYLYQYCWNKNFFSFHTLSGSAEFEVFLFVVAFAFGTCLLIGYKTRIASVASWLLLLSLQNRNPMILQGGDDLLRLMLFWGIFLPWNRRYSVDAFRLKNSSNRADETNYSGLAVMGYVMLVFSVYFFSALLKNSPEWRTDGTALYYAFNLDMIAYPFAKFLLNYPEFLKVATYSVAYLELIVPLLFLIPFRKDAMRLAAIILLSIFHLLIASTLFVGLFPIIGMVTLIGLLPPFIMDKCEARAKIFFLFLIKQKTVSAEPSSESESVFFSSLTIERITDGFLMFMIMYSMVWNITNLPFFPYKLSEAVKKPAYILRFDQNWGMFAPTVFKDDGWFVYEGQTKSAGSAIDLRQHGKLAGYQKPAYEVFNYKNDRWRKYSENFLFIKNISLRPPFCNYLFKEWNSCHPQMRIDSLSITYFKEISVAPQETPTVKKEILCSCK